MPSQADDVVKVVFGQKNMKVGSTSAGADPPHNSVPSATGHDSPDGPLPRRPRCVSARPSARGHVRGQPLSALDFFEAGLLGPRCRAAPRRE
jgi:hypothetical protein